MSQVKLVQFTYNADTARYRADFYADETCVEWKYLTNDEQESLSFGEAVDFTNLPRTYFAEPLALIAENQCLFDDEDNNFMSILREFIS